MQVQPSDASISGISKNFSQYSPMTKKDKSTVKKEKKAMPANQLEEFQYKTIETLEVDNIYNENTIPIYTNDQTNFNAQLMEYENQMDQQEEPSHLQQPTTYINSIDNQMAAFHGDSTNLMPKASNVENT